MDQIPRFGYGLAIFVSCLTSAGGLIVSLKMPQNKQNLKKQKLKRPKKIMLRKGCNGS